MLLLRSERKSKLSMEASPVLTHRDLTFSLGGSFPPSILAWRDTPAGACCACAGLQHLLEAHVSKALSYCIALRQAL